MARTQARNHFVRQLNDLRANPKQERRQGQDHAQDQHVIQRGQTPRAVRSCLASMFACLVPSYRQSPDLSLLPVFRRPHLPRQLYPLSHPLFVGFAGKARSFASRFQVGHQSAFVRSPLETGDENIGQPVFIIFVQPAGLGDAGDLRDPSSLNRAICTTK